MDVRADFAAEYQRLKNWNPTDPVIAARREKLLQIGYMIGVGGAALISAQTHLIPYLKSITGPVTAATQGAGGAMFLWTRAAQITMGSGAHGLGSLAALDAALSFGPAVLIAVGIVLLFYAAHKTKPRDAYIEETV